MQILGQFVHEGLVSLMLAVVGGILMWPYRKIKKSYTELMDAVSTTKAELVLQRTNCLHTLQTQGEKQIELLTKATNTLDGVRLDLAEQTGYLRARS